MKKNTILGLGLSVMIFGLTACGNSESTAEIEEYKTSMESFFDSLEEIDTNIKDIDPSADDALDQLYTQFDGLKEQYEALASLTAPTEGVPETFAYIDSLADEAYDYMVQADDYLNQAFEDSYYNENTLTAALECYNRANKRVLYIVDLLHGEYPQGDNISYN